MMEILKGIIFNFQTFNGIAINKTSAIKLSNSIPANIQFL